MVIEVVAGVLIVLLALSTAVLLTVGMFGFLAGDRIDRCPRCRHYGLTRTGVVHRGDCPAGLREQLAHAAEHWQHIAHRHA